MFEISGLNELTNQLEEMQKALESIDGEIGTVNFDPHDPASIEAAIQSVEIMLDEKLGEYMNNPMVSELAEDMKQQYRDSIIERAAEARLSGDNK